MSSASKSGSDRHRIGLYWLGNDLRLHDNAAWPQAASEVDQLLCVYCLNPADFAPNRYGLTNLGSHRWRFLKASLTALDSELRSLGQQLLVLHQEPVTTLVNLIDRFRITRVYRSLDTGYYEDRQWTALKTNRPQLDYTEVVTRTLFDQHQLTWPPDHYPATFSQFHKAVKTWPINEPLPPVQSLPPCPAPLGNWLEQLPRSTSMPGSNDFQGGEAAAIQHLTDYFSNSHAQHYQDTRNALDGWTHSTKFSPWLANGCLSVRLVLASLRAHQQHFGRNESTEWILFELLWREFFQGYAKAYSKRLFAFTGIKKHKPLTTFYPERFQKWCRGNTPNALVNACMHELNHTGYMSNRGRQIVASYLVNELALDWRFGAAYFEQQLIDYDVAVNWGNWQYLAGVGTDPRGKRHFDLAKQARLYDPDGRFVRRWHGAANNLTLDSVDAADWPLSR